jgi:hypothetical protein
MKERIDVLIERLDRTKDILLHDCSKGDAFGSLALGTLERNLKELVPVIKLIEQSRIIKKKEVKLEMNELEKEEQEEEEKERRHSKEEDRFEERRSSRSNAPAPSSTDQSKIFKSEDSVVPEDDLSTHVDGTRSNGGSSLAVLSPASSPLPGSRSESVRSRLDGPSSSPAAKSSITKFLNRAKETVSPLTVPARPHSSKEEDTKEPRNERHERQTSITSDSSFNIPISNSSTSSSSRRLESPESKPQVRSRSRVSASSSSTTRMTTPTTMTVGRSQQVEKALDMASAPPGSSEEDEINSRSIITSSISNSSRRKSRSRQKKVVRLNEENVIKLVARESDQGTKANLVQVSRKYYKIVEPILYSFITVSSHHQVVELDQLFETKPHLAEIVTSLTVLPLDDNDDDATDPSSLLDSLRSLVTQLPNLKNLDEDFTKSDWDVISCRHGYFLDATTTSKLRCFTSRRSWWEIGALYELLSCQPSLTNVVLGGAAMDRDWEGSKLKASLLASQQTVESSVRSLSVSQIMHEDTLSVLLLLCRNPRFETLSISFQSIGPSDDDTPIYSIPLAFKLAGGGVGDTLTRFKILAPLTISRDKISEDTSSLLEDLLPLLPNLTTLEFQETFNDNIRVPIASSSIFTKKGVLPKSLRFLKARQLFSIKTSEIVELLLLEEVIPVLEEIDIEWAAAAHGEEEEEEWWNQGQVEEIRTVCNEFGIRCKVSKGHRKFTIG